MEETEGWDWRGVELDSAKGVEACDCWIEG